MLAAQISHSSRGDRVAGAREPPPSVSNITKYGLNQVGISIFSSPGTSSAALFFSSTSGSAAPLFGGSEAAGTSLAALLSSKIFLTFTLTRLEREVRILALDKIRKLERAAF